MSLVSISGGAGFLGLHLARRVLADGDAVRTLDVAALDDRELERGVEEVRGDIRSEGDVRALVVRGRCRRPCGGSAADPGLA